MTFCPDCHRKTQIRNWFYGFRELVYEREKCSAAAAAAAKSLQSRPTLCDPIDGSPPGSPVPAILQARTLEWVAISFSNAWKWKVNWSRSVMSNPQWPCGLQPSRLLHPWDFPGKTTGVVQIGHWFSGNHLPLCSVPINCELSNL